VNNLVSAKSIKDKLNSSQNEKISAALTSAITKGDLKLCQKLIERGFDIDGLCECGCTVLVKACLKNQWEIASYFLQLGAPVKGVACAKESSFEGLSAFQLVALNGEFELFEKMFNRGPLTLEEKTQAFYLASKRGRVHILRFLLEHAEDKRPLLEARKRSYQDIEDEKQFIYSEELEYSRPLHLVVNTRNIEAAEILLRAGADLEARDEEGMTALQVANLMGSSGPMVDLLVKAGANLNTRDFNGETPLMHAAREEHGLENVKCLLGFVKGGLDLQATDQDGRTALHHAVEAQTLDTAKFLIEAGLDPLQTDLYGCSPIQKIIEKHTTHSALENLPEVDKLRSKVLGSILNTAVYCGREKVVTELLHRVPEEDAPEYVNLTCDLGTPLYCSAYIMHISIMEKLIEKGAQINLVGGSTGSALMAACTVGSVECVRLLLKKGAELQCTKFDGTIITAEEAAQHHESVLLLLRRYKEKGAHVLDENIPMKTADITELDKFMVAHKEQNEKRIRERDLKGGRTGRPLR
jgi:ankyrin repeat protein